MGRQDDPYRPLHSVAGHLCQNFRQERMPVPHAHINRDSRPLLFQQQPQAIRLAEGELVEGRSASDQFVMVGHFLDPLPGHRTPAQDVVQKRTDLIASGRSPETDQQNGLIGHNGVNFPRAPN